MEDTKLAAKHTAPPSFDNLRLWFAKCHRRILPPFACYGKRWWSQGIHVSMNCTKTTPNPVNSVTYQYKVLPLYLPAQQGHEGSFSHSFTNVKERRWTEAIHIALSHSIPSHHVRRPWVTSYHQMYSNVNFWSLVILFRLPASRQVCRFRYCAKADGSLSWCDRSPASTRRL